ncbi:MAG: hypothetical protein OYG31_02775 [Candidatus Kaiserbacteria bacterium]|nr:hypothetical protein [Candidatus Kaiserbacteria bacterium]
MALSDKRILKEMEAGNIIISPFDQTNLSTSSYDVTLGEYYFPEQEDGSTVYNPFSRQDVDRVWGTEPMTAKTAEEVFCDTPFVFDGIAKEDRVILLDPGETILAHTNEFIGGRSRITTMMKARSSLGRNFIEVCKCAGWGDVGYTNRWTMEITNNSRRHSIPLVVGRRIAQIIFIETGEILGDDYTQSGKYQATTDFVETMQETWDPRAMLPRMYHDREIKHTH